VPRQRFAAGSAFFAKKYGLLNPVANDSQAAAPAPHHLMSFKPQHHTLDKLLHLDGVTKGEFEVFLKLVFPV
jgi:hypothetical protein